MSEAGNWNFRLETLKLGKVKLEQLAQFGAVLVIGLLQMKHWQISTKSIKNLIVVDHHFASSRYDLVNTDFAKQTEQVWIIFMNKIIVISPLLVEKLGLLI